MDTIHSKRREKTILVKYLFIKSMKLCFSLLLPVRLLVIFIKRCILYLIYQLIAQLPVMECSVTGTRLFCEAFYFVADVCVCVFFFLLFTCFLMEFISMWVAALVHVSSVLLKGGHFENVKRRESGGGGKSCPLTGNLPLPGLNWCKYYCSPLCQRYMECCFADGFSKCWSQGSV